jgi:uncharacterized membrane protein
MSDELAPAPAAAGLSDNSAGALAYVTIIPAIIFLVLEPYNKSAFVRFHSWQSIFFAIAFAAVHIILGIIPVIGWLILALLDLGFLVLWVMVILKASKGEKYKLPFIGDLADKQAGV